MLIFLKVQTIVSADTLGMHLNNLPLSLPILDHLLTASSNPALAEDSAQASSLATQLRHAAIANEHGEGVARNLALAASLYCRSARLGDPQSQYNLGWMYAQGRGVARNDAMAAFLFHAAAKQGLPAAQRMLQVVGKPTSELPDCMRARASHL